jgi:hypothetical protein
MIMTNSYPWTLAIGPPYPELHAIDSNFVTYIRARKELHIRSPEELRYSTGNDRNGGIKPSRLLFVAFNLIIRAWVNFTNQ